jgi:hypothetical protein
MRVPQREQNFAVGDNTAPQVGHCIGIAPYVHYDSGMDVPTYPKE